MSNVLRPNRNALAWLLSSVTNSPTAGSGNGACQPPWVKVSLGSSSGPPGACITPSRVRDIDLDDEPSVEAPKGCQDGPVCHVSAARLGQR